MNLEINDSYWPSYIALSLNRNCLFHFLAERCVAVILSSLVFDIIHIVMSLIKYKYSYVKDSDVKLFRKSGKFVKRCNFPSLSWHLQFKYSAERNRNSVLPSTMFHTMTISNIIIRSFDHLISFFQRIFSSWKENIGKFFPTFLRLYNIHDLFF